MVLDPGPVADHDGDEGLGGGGEVGVGEDVVEPRVVGQRGDDACRSAGWRPVTRAGLWWQSWPAPLLAAPEAGLEQRGGAGQGRPRRVAAACPLGRGQRDGTPGRPGGRGRIFGRALATLGGSARMASAHKAPLPVRRGFRGSPRPVRLVPPDGLGIKNIKRTPDAELWPPWGFVRYTAWPARSQRSSAPNRESVRIDRDHLAGIDQLFDLHRIHGRRERSPRAGGRLVPSDCRRGAGSPSRMFTAPAGAGGGPARPSRRTVRPVTGRAPVGSWAEAAAPPRPRGSGRG